MKFVSCIMGCILLAVCASLSLASPRLRSPLQYPADAQPLAALEVNGGRLTALKSTFVKTMGLTSAEKTTILNKHNEYRGDVSPSAVNMRVLQWDSDLAAKAQSWADQCAFSHDSASDRQTGSWWWVGQNIAYGYGNSIVSLIMLMDFWNNEKVDYDLTTNTCSTGAVCGHYTQIVWAETDFVGCGLAVCDRDWGNGNILPTDLLVCNYGLGGNLNGLPPYTSGSSCSSCPIGYMGGCQADLCTLG